MDAGDGGEAAGRLEELFAGGVVTVAEAMAMTTLSKTEVHKLIDCNEIISAKRGRRRLIARRSVLEWLARGVAK